MRSLVAALAVAAACVCSAEDLPSQIHLAYAGANVGTAMAVSWQTVNSTATSIVLFGTSPSTLNISASGSCSTYYQTYDHHVVLTSLTPNTLYYYSCGDSSAGMSSVSNFTTAPTSGSEFPVTIGVIGDMGLYNSNNTFIDLGRIFPTLNFILHIGDISYADDDFLHDPLVDRYEYTWNTFLSDMSPFTSSLAYMVLPGNHEAECHSPICFLDPTKREAFENFTAFNHRFRMPSPESSGTMNMWYSFDYGSIHFIQIDTETDYPNAPNDDVSSQNGNFGNQIAWLTADLTKAAARRAAGEVSWIIVSGHRPVYSRATTDSNGNPNGDALYAQQAFEGLFHTFGVNIYFCGHEHSVEASWPVYNNTVIRSYDKPKYPVYVVTGAAGCDEGHTSYALSPMTSWNRYSNDADYGLSVLTVNTANSLTWEFRRATDGFVLDNFTLTR